MSPLTNVQLLVTIIGTTGTVAAAIAAAKSAMIAEESTKITKETLNRQIEKDSKNIKPILMIVQKEFTIDFSKVGKVETLPIHTFNWDTNELSILGSQGSDKVTIELINLGNGFAKDIKITWDITNLEAAMTAINKSKLDRWYKEMDIEKKIGREREYIELKFIKSEEEKSNIPHQYYLKSYEPEEFIYIAGNQGKVDISIPKAFISLMNLFNAMDYNLINIKEDNFPIIQMDVEYLDVMGEEYKDNYILKVYNSFKSYPVKRDNKFKFTLMPKKI